MTDGLSVAASLIAVIQLTTQVAQLTYEYINKVKKTSRSIRKLNDEIKLLTTVLSNLQIFEREHPAIIAAWKLGEPLRKCSLAMMNLKFKLELPRDWLPRILAQLRWPFEEKEASEYISQVEGLKGVFILAIGADQLNQTATLHRRIVGIETRERRTEALHWLYPDAFDKRHVEISERRRKNTGQWILKTPEFKGWIEKTSRFPLLWGYGIPGAGKTFLLSAVVDHLLDQAETQNNGVAYIYFNYKEQDRQEPKEVLANLLKQLACQIPHLPKELDDLHAKLECEQKRPTLKQLYKILLVVSKCFTQIFVICDALDECDQKSRRNRLLPLFHQMAKDGISLFLTSRYYPEDIQDSFQDSAKLELLANDEDIASYIAQKIDEHPRAKRLIKESKVRGMIISELTKCAKGMFLLVHFHTEYLCQQTTIRQILAELERLKSSSNEENALDPTYDRAMEILRTGSQSCVELALKILTCLVKARRTLTVRELQLAVSVEKDRTAFDEQDLPDEKTLLDVCASLVTVDANTDIIRLAHYTVQEYLLKKSIIPEDADLKLTIACITFLSFDIFAQDDCTSNSSLVTRYNRYPFLDYAAQNLSYHLKACEEDVTMELVLEFLKKPGSVFSYMQALYSPKGCEYDRDHDYYSQKHWHNYHRVYSEAEIILHAAATLGHCSVVQLLLKDTPVMALNRGSTLMYLATFWGQNGVIQLLIEKGVSAYAKQPREWVAMHMSVIRLLKSPMREQAELDISKLDPYKLEVVFCEDKVIQRFAPDFTARQRKVAVKTTWTTKKMIGYGAFGQVFLQEDAERGELRAVKRVMKHWEPHKELKILTELTDNKHLFVNFHGWYEDECYFYIAMEYLRHGNLGDYIASYPNAKLNAREITRQILEGLVVLHEKKIIHRDMKPQNILIACLEPVWVKIVDFGSSKNQRNTQLRTRTGTEGYLAPEMMGLLPRKLKQNTYTNAIDIWSLGCLVHEILTSVTPFLEAENTNQLTFESSLTEFRPEIDIGHLYEYCRGTVEFSTERLELSQVSQEGIDFVKGLLVVDPSHRMCATDALEHPWLLDDPRKRISE